MSDQILSKLDELKVSLDGLRERVDEGFEHQGRALAALGRAQKDTDANIARMARLVETLAAHQRRTA